MIYCLSRTRLREITDGTAYTTIFTEYDVDQDDPWKELSPANCPNLQCYVGLTWPIGDSITTYWGINAEKDWCDRAIQSRHPAGAHFAFVDGHVAFISENVDQIVLENLFNRKDGQDIPTGAY